MGLTVNPLELQVLVLLSGVPEADGGTMFIEATPRLPGISDRQSPKNLRTRSFNSSTEPVVFRPARSSAPFPTPLV